MRRLAFVLLASLLVGLSSATPAQGYWSLFHYPHHLPHPHPHSHHGAVVPAGPVQPITPGQVIGAVQAGQQLFHVFFPGFGQQPNNPQPQPQPQPQPAAQPRIGADVSKTLTENATRLNGVVDKTNALLKLVRANDARQTPTILPDVPKASTSTGTGPDNGVRTSGGGGGVTPVPND